MYDWKRKLHQYCHLLTWTLNMNSLMKLIIYLLLMNLFRSSAGLPLGPTNLIFHPILVVTQLPTLDCYFFGLNVVRSTPLGWQSYQRNCGFDLSTISVDYCVIINHKRCYSFIRFFVQALLLWPIFPLDRLFVQFHLQIV